MTKLINLTRRYLRVLGFREEKILLKSILCCQASVCFHPPSLVRSYSVLVKFVGVIKYHAANRKACCQQGLKMFHC